MENFNYDSFVEEARKDAEKFVRVEVNDQIATIVLTDSEHMNTLSPSLMVGLTDAMRESLNNAQVKAIVLTSEGAFCAGGDIRMMKEVAHPMLQEAEVGASGIWRWIRHQFGGVVRMMHHSDKAVLCAVTGAAAGVGMAFVLAADLVFVDEKAPLLLAFSRLGLVPEVGSSWTLLRRLGYPKTMELFLRTDPIWGKELAEMGLANAALPRDQVLPKTMEWAARITRLGDHVFPMAKTLLRQAGGMTFEQALTMEEFAEPICFTTGPHQRAVNRFLEKGLAGS